MLLAPSRSIVAVALKTYGERRRAILAGVGDPAHAHLDLVRLRTPREAEAWLRELEPLVAARLAA